MSAADIIRIEEDQSLSFGNHHLVEKAKVDLFNGKKYLQAGTGKILSHIIEVRRKRREKT